MQNLECHLWLSIELLESSIMLLDNNNITGVTHDDRHMTIKHIYNTGHRLK
jgi:hypothetical protein